MFPKKIFPGKLKGGTMEYKALYRKYRPKELSDIYGQETIVRLLNNAISKNVIAHAYLFSGPRGTGKTSVAKIFSRMINCENITDNKVCGKCAACSQENNDASPDIIEMDAASNNGVDEIREINTRVNTMPTLSKYKIYIVDEVHMLSTGAFNALLKTLEDPPKHIIFILATTEPQKLPSTIISRCQKIDFRTINMEAIQSCLENIAKKEKINIDKQAMREIAEYSNGGLRDAIGLLDQASIYANKNDAITQKLINGITGMVSNEIIKEVLTAIIEGNLNYLLEFTDEFDQRGGNYLYLINKLLILIKNIIISKKRDSKKIDNIYFKIINHITDLESIIRSTDQKRIAFELGIIKIMNVQEEKNKIKTKENQKSQMRGENVPRETTDKKSAADKEELLKTKNILINNILVRATKESLTDIKKRWKNLNDILLERDCKFVVGILLTGEVVAASDEGVIVALTNQKDENRLKEKVDLTEEILFELLNKKTKVAIITIDRWKEMRPIFAKKAKAKTLLYIDEETEFTRTNKNRCLIEKIPEFDDIIEMERK